MELLPLPPEPPLLQLLLPLPLHRQLCPLDLVELAPTPLGGEDLSPPLDAPVIMNAIMVKPDLLCHALQVCCLMFQEMHVMSQAHSHVVVNRYGI